MMRNAIYTIYNGTEYRIFRNRYGKYILVSHDKKDESKGFIKEDEQDEIYLKEVTSSEVGEVYDISPYAIYKGHRFGINSENETDYYLGTGDTALAKALGFEMIDREVYRKWVPKKDMEKVYEVKTPMPNFFK
ncbi:hypothetical protein [Neisseria sp. Ec49-e6-T10]|uniref:hypothetical protein n=1 Tax=Neisseria sp. Ec49-e6-T10 TaxID=3140744 RepID=UPI003EBD3697